MASIEQDLKNSHLVIDGLHRDLNSSKSLQVHYDQVLTKCKSATDIYKSKIKELRARLAQGRDYVPMKTHEKVVESSKLLVKSLEEKEMQIKHLTQRIHNLENIIKKNHLNSANIKGNKNAFTISSDEQHAPKGRAALLERMKKQSAKDFIPGKEKRSALGLHNHYFSPRYTASYDM
jgi:hypothetical protein